MYNDNGPNFVGAANKLDKDLKLAIRGATKEVAKLIEDDGTTWKFIPPATPHFGGIWEAGVKSMKTHLKKVIGEHLHLKNSARC
jgi:hypothetical protein